MIELIQINGNKIDLSVSPKFVEHYNKPNSFAAHVIDKEINAGLWYDDLLASLPEHATIIDIGANVGLFSLYLGGEGRRFFCVEPSDYHTAPMIELFDKFHIHGEVFMGVVHNRDGFVKLEEVSGNTTCNKVSSEIGNTPSFTLNTFFGHCNLDSVDLLKLDCEGSEEEIINDPTSEPALKKCKLVFIEVHPEPWGHTDEAGIIEKMKPYGFAHKPGKRGLSHYFINSAT